MNGKKGVNKNKAKGTTYNKYKNEKKTKKLEEEKKNRKRAENRRQNSMVRKDRGIKKENMQKIEENVTIVGFRRGMLLLKIGEEIEKRALIYSRKANLKTIYVDDIEVKLYGENVKLRDLNGFEEMQEYLREELAYMK